MSAKMGIGTSSSEPFDWSFVGSSETKAFKFGTQIAFLIILNCLLPKNPSKEEINL